VCKEHIEKMLKSDRRECIRCADCSENFEIDANTVFKPNRQMSKLLESLAFLSEEEKRLKVKIEQTLQNIDNSYENFKEIFAKHEVARYDYFRDLRADIDTRRHELIEQVHNLSDALIERLKKVENEYNSHVNETVKCKSLDFKVEREIEKLDEMFRSLSINVSHIRDKEAKDIQTLNDLNEDILRLEEFTQEMLENKFKKNDKFKLDSSQIGDLTLKAPRGRLSNEAVHQVAPVVNVPNVNLNFDEIKITCKIKVLFFYFCI
jgi:protein-arginine kinase activator protein McsA